MHMGCPGGSVVNTCCQCRRQRFDPWARKILWSRKWQPTPGFFFFFPLQDSCLGKPMDRGPGTLQFTGSQKSWTRLSNNNNNHAHTKYIYFILTYITPHITNEETEVKTS